MKFYTKIDENIPTNDLWDIVYESHLQILLQEYEICFYFRQI
jgi:hypothetical protein